MKFCCEELPYRIKGNPKRGKSQIFDFYDTRTNCSIGWYIPKERLYLIMHNPSCASYMCYCYKCGKKMPDSLEDKWHEILKNEFALTDPTGDDRDKVPPEFWTDEWWKKRGL